MTHFCEGEKINVALPSLETSDPETTGKKSFLLWISFPQKSILRTNKLEAEQDHWGQCSAAYIHECSIDVVTWFTIHGDEEGQAPVQGQHIHAAVLVMVPGQKTDAAIFWPNTRCHNIESLWRGKGKRERQTEAGWVSLNLLQEGCHLHNTFISKVFRLADLWNEKGGALRSCLLS